MTKPGDNIEAVLFKEVPGGYVFRAPNPRLLGRGEHYLVTPAQHDSIVAILTPRRPLLALIVWALACLLALAGFIAWAATTNPDYPNTTLAVFIATAVAATVLALHLSARAKLRRLQPILAHAPRTDERITSAEMRLALGKPFTTEQLRRMGLYNAILGALSVVAVVVMAWLAKQPTDYLSIPGAVFNGIIAIQCWASSLSNYRSAAEREAQENGSRRASTAWHNRMETCAIQAGGIAMAALVVMVAWSGIASELSDLKQGQRHAARNLHDQAIDSFSKAIVARPGQAAAYLRRADSYAAKGARDRAIQDYTKVVELEPRNVVALRKRADAHKQNNAFDPAIADYTRVIELSPDSAAADHYFVYLNRGITFKNKGDIDRAIDDFTMAIKIDMNRDIAYYFRGISFAQQKEHVRAIEDLTSSIQRKPSDVYAHLARARSHGATKDHARAVADLSRAIEIDPNSMSAYGQRAAAHASADARELAIADYRAVMALPALSAADHHRQDAARRQLQRLMATPATSQGTTSR